MYRCPDCGGDRCVSVLSRHSAKIVCDKCPREFGNGVEMVDDGMTEADVEAAYAAYDEIIADRRAAFREALTMLLNDGPDAVDAAEGQLRSRMDNDGCYALSLVIEVLHPEHRGIYWARESDGLDA